MCDCDFSEHTRTLSISPNKFLSTISQFSIHCPSVFTIFICSSFFYYAHLLAAENERFYAVHVPVWIYCTYNAKVNDEINMYLHNNNFLFFFSVWLKFDSRVKELDSDLYFVLFSICFFLIFMFKKNPSHWRIQLHRPNKKQTKRKTCDVMLLRSDRKLDCFTVSLRSGEGVSVFLRDSVLRRIRYYVPRTPQCFSSSVSLTLGAPIQSCCCCCYDCCVKLTTPFAVRP